MTEHLPAGKDDADEGSLQEAPDLSSPLPRLFGIDFCSKVIAVYVGPERTFFSVHKDLLTRHCSFFDRALNGSFREAKEEAISLEEDDPDAFGLLLNWLYKGKLPFFNPAVLTQIPAGYEMAGQDDWRTNDSIIVLPSSVGAGRVIDRELRFRHVVAQPMYTSLSPEELRFLEAPYTAGRTHAADYAKYLQAPAPAPSPQPTSRLQTYDITLWPLLRSPRMHPPPTSPLRDLKLALDELDAALLSKATITALQRHLADVEGIPVTSPFALHVQAEHLQLTLVKLLVFAEKYAWAELFNDAMDAFRHGEVLLGRRWPVTRHLEIAYAGCVPKSILLAFFADFAFWGGNGGAGGEVTLNEMMENWAEGLPDLAKQLQERIEGKAETPTEADEKNPLQTRVWMYHAHGEDWSIDGTMEKCPPECRRRRERRQVLGLMLRGR